MKNYRKLVLGFAYLIVCGVLGFMQITKSGAPFDGTGLGVMFGGLASGVLAIVWGNTKEHQSNRKPDA